MKELKNIIDEITSSKVIKIVLSNKKNKDFKYNKIKFSLKENLKGEFYQTEDFTFDIKISKKGKILLNKKKSDNKSLVKKSHNKEKNYILKEGMIIEPLIDLGIFTKDGKVINSKYDK